VSQIFHPSTNPISKVTIFGAVFIVAGLLALLYFYFRSPYITRVGIAPPQPVQFDHEHHTAGLGIDCRYCHVGVEVSAFADIPPVHTCMTCHSQIWNDSPMLAPVIASYESGIPLQWVRVHNMPDFVFFNHGIHIQKGVGCSSCHGNVSAMPLMWQAEPMTMEWCLECHREPERHLRPLDQVFVMDWQPPADQHLVGRQLLEEYGVRTEQLLDCYICHR
jgi:hypothetical protein